MKFNISREFFVAGLSQVANIVNNRGQLPVFNNVLIEAEDGKIQLTTSNLDIAIRCIIKADVITPGSITLPIKTLKESVSAMLGNEVSVELFSETRVKIKSGSSNALMTGIEATQFPAFRDIQKENLFVIDQNELLLMLNNVVYAQSMDENRYVLNGVFFNFSENGLTLVATDGRRLSISDHKVEDNSDNKGVVKSFILPAKTVGELVKQLGTKGKVSIALNERQVMFEIDSDEKSESGFIDKVKIISKIVEGNYPQYKQVIPKDSNNTIEIEREMFLHAAEFINKFMNEKMGTLYLDIGNNSIDVSTSDGENEANNKIAVQYEGNEIKIAFNPKFILDPLKALTQDIVVFEFKDELSPGVIKTKDSKFLSVIMPQRR